MPGPAGRPKVGENRLFGRSKGRTNWPETAHKVDFQHEKRPKSVMGVFPKKTPKNGLFCPKNRPKIGPKSLFFETPSRRGPQNRAFKRGPDFLSKRGSRIQTGFETAFRKRPLLGAGCAAFNRAFDCSRNFAAYAVC